MKAALASRWFRVLSAMFLPVATGAAAAPVGGEPDALLRQAVGEILVISNAPDATPARVREGVRRLFGTYVDPWLLTRRAIGPGWRGLTAAQQQRAVTLFTDLALGAYADKFTPGLHPKVIYRTTVDLAPNRREVPISITTNEGEAIELAFRFEETGAGWRIYDIVVEGVSLVANYRSQFGPIFQSSGASGVLRALEAKTAELTPKP
jgi:phospholipid transport system substrate-binding protein